MPDPHACVPHCDENKKALEAAESHADLGLELFLPSCNEVMSALGENGAGSAGDESGPASAGDVLRRMYTLLDVMCRAGVRPDRLIVRPGDFNQNSSYVNSCYGLAQIPTKHLPGT